MKELGTTNKNFYHWKIEEYEDSSKETLKSEKMYKTVLNIQEDYPQFNRTKIYNLHNNHYKNKKDCCREYQRFIIKKIKEPIENTIEKNDKISIKEEKENPNIIKISI